MCTKKNRYNGVAPAVMVEYGSGATCRAGRTGRQLMRTLVLTQSFYPV